MRRSPVAESVTLNPGTRRQRSPLGRLRCSRAWCARVSRVIVIPSDQELFFLTVGTLALVGPVADLPLGLSGVVAIAAHVSSGCSGRSVEEPVDAQRSTCQAGPRGSAGLRPEPFQRSSGRS